MTVCVCVRNVVKHGVCIELRLQYERWRGLAEVASGSRQKENKKCIRSKDDQNVTHWKKNAKIGIHFFSRNNRNRVL